MADQPSTTEIYEQITQTILNALDAGTVPWHKPWTSSGLHQQSVHGRPYRGLNQLLLGLEAQIKGYDDPRWITFNQARKQGGQVRKGEKSTIVTLWKRIVIKDENAPDGKKVIPILRIYRVFNVAQTTLDLPPIEAKLREHTPVEEAELIWDGFQDRPTMSTGHAGAWYSPSSDEIGMPDAERFDSAEHYYSTLFHEAVHSTGAKVRLDRDEVSGGTARFGSGDYSREELVAEIGAAMLRGVCGIDSEAVMSNTAAYIQSWRSKLSDDPKLIVQAAGKAQKAADYIQGIGWDDEAKAMTKEEATA